MKQSTINIRVIEPSEGYYLTQANRKEYEEVILSEKVILSAKDSPENWVEIPKEEGEALQKRVSAEFMAKADAEARENEMGG
ncbi:MAG: hypothetical protein U0L19_11025 [Bacteroidales bacterium]|nr:hypothetical protein [Bacteroidales bacterium]